MGTSPARCLAGMGEQHTHVQVGCGVPAEVQDPDQGVRWIVEDEVPTAIKVADHCHHRLCALDVDKIQLS
jgi:hypothetical protein